MPDLSYMEHPIAQFMTIISTAILCGYAADFTWRVLKIFIGWDKGDKT